MIAVTTTSPAPPVGHSNQRLDISYLAAINAADRAQLVAIFPDLAALDSTRFLALRPLLDGCPERFFDRSAYSIMLDWLKDRDATNRGTLQAYLSENKASLNSALHFLRQVNSEDWHDDPIKGGGDYEVMRLIDKVVHPAYLRLTEAVLAPLVRMPAHFSLLDRGKGTERLDIFNVVEALSKTDFAECLRHYHPTVRNGIGHGGVIYRNNSIRYQDKKGGSEEIAARDVVRLFDDMLDTCNGFATAFKVFLLSHKQHGYTLPLELMIEELRESTRSPWWSVDSCIESEVPGGEQLLIYAKPDSRHELKIWWASTHTAMVAESLTPGYKRYFIPMNASKESLGFAAFDGKKLEALRLSGAHQVHQYIGAFEEIGFFFHPKSTPPRILGQIETFSGIAKSHSSLIRTQMRDAMNYPKIVCRNSEIERRSWKSHLRGKVVITISGGQSMSQVIRRHKRRILRKVATAARSGLPRFDRGRYVPLAFAHIDIYCEDFRRRRLDGFGLGRQLVCTLQLHRTIRTRTIRVIDILDSTAEVAGSWRIVWNKQWLAKGGAL
ncbi:hypothetical protein [Pseudoxanthomonas suwonensis]|uniref:hypothetical protein n=1 Tax=Pseudoxanthomonas suwonensis TaxID=314722 RepID=UPI00118556DC|nr:hypothetical protein [Pseudoxanthomonas suwonensis]